MMKVVTVMFFKIKIVNTTCIINYMFGRAIWDKLLEHIFDYFETAKISKITRVIYPQHLPNQTYHY